MKKQLLKWAFALVCVFSSTLAYASTLGVAASDAAYAVLSKDSTTLTFYYDGSKAARATSAAAAYDVKELDPYVLPSWCHDSKVGEKVLKVSFDTSFKNYSPTYTSSWFYMFKSVKSIDLTNLNTSSVTSMAKMFYRCSSLPALDVSKFNTSNVTNMSGMFYGCNSLEALDVSGFDTKNVTDMSQMFYMAYYEYDKLTKREYLKGGASKLTSLDVSSFNTSNVTDMENMFAGCNSLTTLDVTGIDTKNVKTMKGMFWGCTNLPTIDLSSFNTSNVTNMENMFWGCESFTTLDLSSFDTKNVTTMNGMFANCESLTKMDISHFDMSSLKDAGRMFDICSSLRALYVGSNDFSSTDNHSDCFGGVGSPQDPCLLYYTDGFDKSVLKLCRYTFNNNGHNVSYYTWYGNSKNEVDTGSGEYYYGVNYFWPGEKADSRDEAVTLNETVNNESAFTEFVTSKVRVNTVRTLSPTVINTFSLPFNVPEDSLKAKFGDDAMFYEFNEVIKPSGSIYYFNYKRHYGDLKAGVPYMVKVTKTVSNPVFKQVPVDDINPYAAEPTTITSNDLNVTASFIGTSFPQELPNKDKNILFYSGAKMFYPEVPDGEPCRIKGQRGYFQIVASANAKKANFQIVLEDTPTEIKGVKEIKNSDTDNNEYYDLSGRRIYGNAKGIVIHGGKKVLVK